MKNKFKYIACLLFVLLLILKFISNGFMFDWYRVSETKTFSKNKGLFIADYDVELIHNLTNKPDSIYMNFLDSLTIWSEYEWHRKPFLVFFHPVQRTSVKTIVIKSNNKFSDTLITKRKVRIKIKGRRSGGTIRNRNHLILKPDNNTLSKNVEIIAYENNLKKFFEAKLYPTSDQE